MLAAQSHTPHTLCQSDQSGRENIEQSKKVLASRECEENNSEMQTSGLKGFFALLAAMLVLSAPPGAKPAAAATNSIAPNTAPAPKTDKTSRGLPFHGNVASVDKAGNRITLEGKKQRVFYVTRDTKIERDKKPSRLDALVVGDYVGGYIREAPDGKWELVSLHITPKTAPPKDNGKPAPPPKPTK